MLSCEILGEMGLGLEVLLPLFDQRYIVRTGIRETRVGGRERDTERDRERVIERGRERHTH